MIYKSSFRSATSTPHTSFNPFPVAQASEIIISVKETTIRVVGMLSALFVVLTVCSSVVYAWSPATYPEYCSKDIDSKQIPALSANDLTLVTELKQVQVMIRHGARTPYAKMNCWKNYDVTWNNCNVTELMLASPSYTDPSRPSPWLFRKLYDGSANYLGGNCYTGQLLLEGYQQEEKNGFMLLDAYVNGPLPLFANNNWDEQYSANGFYLRSDDEQRTLMSGQILLHTFFNVTDEVIVPWHTGDYNLDQIYPNSNVCPRLNQIEDQGYATPEWIAENTSQAITQLTSDLDQIWGAGYWSWGTALDCMMTAVCTNRPLPSGSDSTVLMSEAIFNATVAQVEYTYAFMALNNNSIWAKTAMGNIAWQMRNNLLNIISGGTSSAGSTTPLKFALFSAHDTSLMPFLAAVLGDVWDGRWAGYAYLVSMELYSASAASPLGAGGYYFRLIYNGQAMLVPGCTQSLCDVNVLLDRLAFGQESMPCSVPTVVPSTEDDSCGDDNAALSTTHWSLLLVLSLVVGALIGAAGVVFLEKRRTLGESIELSSSPSTHPLHNTM